ncbi:ankyrin repeat domain-containing protein [Paenalcaligenes hominis]|uniref:ankyrin repeat domain-containing protein n=1 Tax=Paenalcaligenes hominis TaxID=643674 RepID=UPI003524F632
MRPTFCSALTQSLAWISGAFLSLPLLCFAQSPMSLFDAIAKNDENAVIEILTHHPDLEVRNAQQQTPLMTAVYQGNTELALRLIQAGADVNAQDAMANSPFLYAGAEGMIAIVREALNHGADFSVFNRYGGTALIPAAEKGHLDVVQLLASTPDYPINHINRLGWTALMEAVILGDGSPTQVEIVKTLLEAGADATIPDKNGTSALHHAEARGFTDMATLLKTHLAK